MSELREHSAATSADTKALRDWQMKSYVAVTDESWFEFLAKKQPDEVSFWPRPPGAPYVPKLHLLVGGKVVY